MLVRFRHEDNPSFFAEYSAVRYRELSDADRARSTESNGYTSTETTLMKVTKQRSKRIWLHSGHNVSELQRTFSGVIGFWVDEELSQRLEKVITNPYVLRVYGAINNSFRFSLDIKRESEKR